MDSNGAPVICEVCGTYFETRRGLSSHARLHLRQLGVSMSESSGAPIELLYKILEEKDVPLSTSNPDNMADVSPATLKAAQKESSNKGSSSSSSSSKAWSKFTTVSSQKSSSVSPSPGFKEYSSSSSVPSSSSNATSSVGSYEPVGVAKQPLWAPQLTDAPLTLASNSKDEAHVCQLCGAWYETRKGLSSHARAHLRQLGITSDSAGDGRSPIELLNEIIKAEDLKPGGDQQEEEPPSFSLHSPHAKSISTATKRPSALSTVTTPTLKGSPSSSSSSLLLEKAPPPSKRARTSTTLEDYTCILCGEEFENRKGLGSHSRSHLRQLGVSHLLEKGSAIDAVQELVSSGVLAGIRPLETNVSAPSPTSLHSRSLSPIPATSSAQSPSSSSSPASRAPKAKKGFRLALVDPLSRKPKPEEVDMLFPVTPERYGGYSKPLTGPSAGVERSHSAIPLVQCDFCSQLFDSRKALSCHARAHLRQLGITWSVNESPIDLLRDVMAHEVKKEASSGGRFSASSGGVVPTWAPQGPMKSSLDLQRHAMLQDPPGGRHYASPLDFSLKEKSSPPKSGSTQAVPVTSCELCGFEFDNRKALASHCRAHLRQLGIVMEWKAVELKGASPIVMLHEFIQKEPAKVAEITRRYRTGDLFIKKTQKNALSPAPSDSDTVSGTLARQSVHRVYLFNGGESSKATQSQEQRPQAARSHMQARAACSTDLSAPRSSTGFWPPKSSLATEEESSASQQASRSGNIPALLPRPPRTPLVKLVGKVYSLKCRFCEEVFQGPLSVQADWIRHLQKHILSLGYRGKASTLPAPPVAAPPLVGAVAV